MKRRRWDKGGGKKGWKVIWDGGLCFRRRPVISNQLWLTDSGGKFLGVNAACHSEGAGVSSWESGDEGRINWHSGGERWRESDGDPADGHTLSLPPSITLFFFFSVNDCTVLCVFWVGGVVKAGGSDRSFTLGVTCIHIRNCNLYQLVKLNVFKLSFLCWLYGMWYLEFETASKCSFKGVCHCSTVIEISSLYLDRKSVV